MIGTLFRTSFVLLILALFASRFSALESSKPYHHDESIHAVEAWKYATQGEYKFNPMLHGPLLYHYVAAVFKILPINSQTGRGTVACLGVLAALLGLFLFSQSGSKWTWLWFFTLSPILCYYSRTLIHDLLMIFLVVAMLVSVIRMSETNKPRYLYFAAVSFSLMLCTKLNSVMYAFSIFAFVPFVPHWQTRGMAILRSHPFHVVGSLLTLSFVFVLFYSSLFSHWPGVLDGLYRKMLPYWAHQDRIQRIKGPFDYYLPILAIYELPVLFGMFVSLARALRAECKSAWPLLAFLIAIPSLYFGLRFFWNGLAAGFEFIHMSDPFHPILALLCVWSGWILVRFHVQRKEFFAALSIFWGASSFLLYSYAGEKVPWLSIHILFPLLVYLSATLPSWFGGHFRKPGVLVLFTLITLWQGFITYQVAFPLAADPKERLVYTHTTWDVDHLVRQIESAAQFTNERERFGIQVVGNSAWPLYWYLRDYKNWFRISFDLKQNPWVIVCDWGEEQAILNQLGPRTYQIDRYKLRHWWVPDMGKATWGNLIEYYFMRTPFSPLGSSDLAVLVRNDLYSKWKAF